MQGTSSICFGSSLESNNQPWYQPRQIDATNDDYMDGRVIASLVGNEIEMIRATASDTGIGDKKIICETAFSCKTATGLDKCKAQRTQKHGDFLSAIRTRAVKICRNPNNGSVSASSSLLSKSKILVSKTERWIKTDPGDCYLAKVVRSRGGTVAE